MNKTIITTAVAAIAALALNSCATTEASSEGSPKTTASAPAGIERYPFDTCLVTDNELGSMGDPVTLVHGGREVKFCCAPCVRKFNADPEKYMARLDRWIADAAS